MAEHKTILENEIESAANAWADARDTCREDAQRQWTHEMVDAENLLTPWTAFEVRETHDAGIQGLRESERARLCGLYEAAGREQGLVNYLNDRQRVTPP